MPHPNLTAEQIADFKQALLDEKARVEDDRADYVSQERDDTEEGGTDDLADYDPNDPADEASNLFDRDREMAASNNMARILGKIERALQKIQDGTYGLSDIDGTPIPVERLEALPYALTTVEQEDSV